MNAARRRCHVYHLLVAGGWLFVSLVDARGQPPARTRAVALVGGRILTQTDAGAIEGTIVLRDGKIVAVGTNVTVPEDAERIDVHGYVITPGLIDARSSLWLTADAVREGAADGGLNVLDGIDPHSEDWREVVRQGVTAVYVQPAASGMLGGRGAVLRVGPGETVEEIVIKADAAAQAALGTQQAAQAAPAAAQGGRGRRGGGPPVLEPADPTPAPITGGNSLTRFAQYEQLRRALEAVKNAPAGSKRDETRDFLRKVLKGDVPLRLEAHREDDIRNALRLADDLKLHLVLDGVSNPKTAGDVLAARRLPLVLGPFVDLEDGPTSHKDRPASWPNAFLTPDTHWALGTFSSQPRGSRLLRVQAAAAVARGLDPDHVLRAMTRDAAEILGLGDRGTIAAGKQADLVVFAGDPLDPSVAVRLVFSGGKVVYRADVKPAPVVARESTPLSLPTRLPKSYVLRTQRLLHEDGSFQPGTVLVENGKVAAVGPSLAVHDGVPVFDLGAAVVAPGLVAVQASLGLTGAIDDPAEANAGQVRAADVFDPQQREVRDMLKGGFTTALFAPGSVNVIGGSAMGVRLGAGEPVPGDGVVKFDLTSNSRGAGPSTAADPLEEVAPALFGRSRFAARYPGSLAGQIELIELVLNGKAPPTEMYIPTRVRDQVQAERRRQVAALLERKQTAYFEAHTRAEVEAALRLIGRYNLRAVLVGPEEIKPLKDEIKRLGVGIVARPAHAGDYDRYAQELVEAAKAGIPVAFGSGPAQDLRITAALAVNAGMAPAAAWRGLTTTAARAAGMPDGSGKLAVGAPADLVIWDGSPLDLCSRPLRVVVDGK